MAYKIDEERLARAIVPLKEIGRACSVICKQLSQSFDALGRAIQITMDSIQDEDEEEEDDD